MEAFLVSAGVVLLAEIGDKTQLLALVLAVRFQKPLPVIAGIFLATVLNHGLAGALGVWIIANTSAETVRWVLVVSFFVMAAWMMIPERDDKEHPQLATQLGVFGATLLTFFLIEMGDKSQIAAVALAVHFHSPVLAVLGTTSGMMIANIPAVVLGHKLAPKIPLRLLRGVAAAIFVVLAALALP